MDKPVIFFSHSSKDRDIILPLKDKLGKITSGTVDIFMSSDGQSIPFGSNWIHKVEEGLKEARIMFVFVTEASLSSGWIYFEAGFAYSKGIQVVPVGIGVNIGSLKPPLNLLQGFNITSGDSLNNFVSIINREFSCSFPESFVEDDFYAIQKTIEGDTGGISTIRDFMSGAFFDMVPKYTESDGSKVEHDIDSIYEKIVAYLDSNSISYSKYTSQNGDIFITVEGIKLKYHKKFDESKNDFFIQNQNNSFIRYSISLYNFEKSIELLKKLVSVSGYKSRYIKFLFGANNDCIVTEEDISSIISGNTDLQIDRDKPFSFTFAPSDLKAVIGTEQKDNTVVPDKRNYISIVYKEETQIENIVVLINRLHDIGIIFDVN